MTILARIEDWLYLTQMCRCVDGDLIDMDGVRKSFCCMRVEPGQMYCRKHLRATVKLRKKEGS